MRVLVTGAGGRLGRTLVTQLRSETSNAVFAAVSPRQLQRAPGEVVIDLESDENITGLVLDTQPDAIVHLAGLVGPECDVDADRTHRINVGATATLTRVAAQCRVARLVLASTSAVYGDKYARPIDENAALDVRSAYAASKLSAEHAVKSGVGGTLSGIALRIFNIYGDSFSGSLVTRLRESTADSPVTLAGLDGFVRDYVSATDVCRAITTALRAPLDTAFDVINIGSGEALSCGDVVDRLCQHGTLHYTVGEERQSYSVADISKARTLLQFDPQPLA